MIIEQKPSPNFNQRRSQISLIVLHYTGMENGEVALGRMRNAASEVSAHYMVWETGAVSQLVEESERAWHAGVASWQGVQDINSCSIGIEIVNGGHNVPREDGTLPPYPEAQIEAVTALCKAIMARHAIAQIGIVGHSDVAPGRKADPGEHFPWQRLAEAGVGLWPGLDGSPSGASWLTGGGLSLGDSGPPVLQLRERMAQIGYGLPQEGVYDTSLHDAILAFQRRWCPDRLTGQADLTTLRRIIMVEELYRGEGDGQSDI